jgi:hypothetical protein
MSDGKGQLRFPCARSPFRPLPRLSPFVALRRLRYRGQARLNRARLSPGCSRVTTSPRRLAGISPAMWHREQHGVHLACVPLV